MSAHATWLRRRLNESNGGTESEVVLGTMFSFTTIAQAFFRVMASQVRPGLTQPTRRQGTSTVRLIDQASTSKYHQGPRLRPHNEAGCMAAISPCETEPKEALGKTGASMYVAGQPHATEDKNERARRQDRLQWASSTWDPLPFDAEAARAYGRMFAAARAAGQSSRSRLADLLIASTAAANSLPLYTRNPA